MKKYVVNVTPHYYYFGLPSDPTVSITVDEYKCVLGFIPVREKQVFDTFDRDLFTAVAKTNEFFKENKITEEQVTWPDWCKYIKGYEG